MRVTKGGSLLLSVAYILAFGAQLAAQDLGPHFKKLKEGIYVYAGQLNDANVTIIQTQEGIVLIDTGQTPKASHIVMAALKKLTAEPVRFIIHTEPHSDHTVGNFVFSPPALVIAHAGATDSMKKAYNPATIQKRAAESPEMTEAYKGFRLVMPHLEYRDKMTLNLGERTLELYYLKNVHSEADTAIWMPKERIVFTAASVTVKRFGNHRPFVSIPDTLSAIKMMKGLNPDIVVPGHGDPGTGKILDDMERYYNLLMERVGAMVKAGKSLDDIKKDLKMPETDDWAGKDRFHNNIEAAYRAVKGS
jgi:cyclase